MALILPIGYNRRTMRLIAALLLFGSALCAQPDVIRAKMLKLIGGLPETRTPLKARITRTFEREGYRVENVLFESLPGFWVTANLYVPTTGKAPYPAVLGTAGHSDLGKSYEVYQHVWISLARRGYVVFAIDPVGQGERIEYPDPVTGKPRFGAGVNEHIHAGLQCLLTGAPIARYFIWDGIRAIDYLLSRPEVDPARLGVAGNSGGGTQAAYLAAFEPAIKAVVSSCYITRWKELMAGPGPQDAEQVFPGFLKEGLDFADFLRAHAPKPFLIASAIRDYFPIAGARATFDLLRQYKDVEMAESDAQHGWGPPLREATYRFLDKHLRGVTDSPPEAPVQPEPEANLRVLSGARSPETVYSLNRKLASEIYPKRRAVQVKDPSQFRLLIRERLALKPPQKASRGVPGTKPAVLAVGLTSGDLESYRARGYVIREVDPPKFPAGRGGYTGAYQAAAREWLYGRSLPAVLVEQLEMALVELAAQPEVDPKRVAVAGRGNAAVAAKLLAALHPEIASFDSFDAPASWYQFTQQPEHTALAEIVVPGVLLDFDLPDLERLLPSARP